MIVLEQRDAPTTESRASTLHARTMELFDQRGLLDHLGTPPHVPMGHFGGIPLDLRLDSPFAGQWKVPQKRTEELLGVWARGIGAELRRGHRVRSLRQHHDRVEVEADGPRGRVRLFARYVVGCDGENSTVRELAGFPFPGTSAERELIRGDADGIDIPDRRFQRLEKGLAIAARGADGVTRVMVHQFGRPAEPRITEPEYAELADVWRTVTGEDITAGVPLWVNSFGDASRQVSRYRDGLVLLAGDAAHRQMPIGGQALNLGLQDAVNLGWKLAAVVLGRAHEALLDSYDEERHAVGREVLSGIRAQARLLLGGPEVEPLRSVLGELIAYEDVRRHLAGTISGLGIRYGSDQGHALLGTRLPPTELTVDTTTTSTSVLLRRARGSCSTRRSGAAVACSRSPVHGWTGSTPSAPLPRPAHWPRGPPSWCVPTVMWPGPGPTQRAWTKRARTKRARTKKACSPHSTAGSGARQPFWIVARRTPLRTTCGAPARGAPPHTTVDITGEAPWAT